MIFPVFQNWMAYKKPHCCELHIIRESCAKERKLTTLKQRGLLRGEKC